eukprot:g2151.t1 g2151   contig11:826342-827571(+)
MRATLLLTIAVSASFISCSTSFSARTTPSSRYSTPLALSSTTTQSDTSITKKFFWKWRGHDIFGEYRVPIEKDSNKIKPTVILLHGFGASTTYWRETMSTLQNEGYEVHALDLLGQGRSSKPIPMDTTTTAVKQKIGELPEGREMGKNTDSRVVYSINLWGELVDDYASHHKLGESGLVLMGNSLGSLVALSAATGDFRLDEINSASYISPRVKGVCLFNCAVGLNSQNVLKNPNLSSIQVAIFSRIFYILNALIFDNQALLRYALNNIVTKQLLRDALRGLYLNSPERVDDELVDSFYYPAKFGGEGAVEAIRQIYTNDAGLTPMELHDKYPEVLNSFPLHLIWGDEDAVTPINGDVGAFYCDRVANNRGGRGLTTIDVVKGGHIPFDENPVQTHGAMLKWLEKKVVN